MDCSVEFPGPLAQATQTSQSDHQIENTCKRTGDDNLLMRRLQNGDIAAFNFLVEKYKQGIINYAARTIGDGTEAQDIAQKTFIQVFRCCDKFQCQSRFSSWLFMIARNLCLNELRRRARHRTESLEQYDHSCERQLRIPAEFTDRPVAAERVLESELVTKLQEVLAELPEKQRTAILLLREENFSYADIARILQTSVSATKSLIHYGRQKLKRKLFPYLGRSTRKRNGLHAPPNTRPRLKEV